jgi:hypothetical protein
MFGLKNAFFEFFESLADRSSGFRSRISLKIHFPVRCVHPRRGELFSRESIVQNCPLKMAIGRKKQLATTAGVSQQLVSVWPGRLRRLRAQTLSSHRAVPGGYFLSLCQSSGHEIIPRAITTDYEVILTLFLVLPF